MLEIVNVSKTYHPKKGVPVKALDNVSLKLEDHGMVFILGKSGSGKSTLLNVLGGLDAADKGEFIIKGKSSKNFSQADFDSYRNTFIGFIFQEYNILPEFTVGENIALAMELQGKKATDAELNAILTQVDLEGYKNRKPNELSGGQKQRVAIARALVKAPEIIMADEPSGALDSKTGKQVFDTLKKLSLTKLVIVVSHDREFAEQYGDRIIELKDGVIISDVSKTTVQANEVSEGVSIVEDGLLYIKKGYRLSPSDLETINTYIQRFDCDTFISSGEKTNSELKRVAKIGDDGSKDAFIGTEDEKLKIKSYTPADSKLIRSRLPFKNALRIGASSLKSKPIRLMFTIFLCLVAFTLFGISDTVSAYKKNEVLYQSIVDSAITSASFQKNYIDPKYGYETEMLLTADDVKSIKDETRLELIPVFGGFDTWNRGFKFDQIISNRNKLTPQNSNGIYYGSELSGYAELTESSLSAAGLSLIGDSRLPVADNEIAITKYIYDHLVYGGYVYYDTATNETVKVDPDSESGVALTDVSQILGKTFVWDSNSGFETTNIYRDDGNGGKYLYETKTLVKIVGVIDTHRVINDKYKPFLPAKHPEYVNGGEENILDMLTIEEMNYATMYSYDALVAVNQGMLDKMIERGKQNSKHEVAFGKHLGNQANLGLYSTKNGTSTQRIATLSQAKSFLDISWVDGEKTSLSAGEVIIPYQIDYERFNGMKVSSATIDALKAAGFALNDTQIYELENNFDITGFSFDYAHGDFYLSKVTFSDVPQAFKDEYFAKQSFDPSFPQDEKNALCLDEYKYYLAMSDGGFYNNEYPGYKSGIAYNREFVSIIFRTEGVTSYCSPTGEMYGYSQFGFDSDIDSYTIVGYYAPGANYPSSQNTYFHDAPFVVSDEIYNAFRVIENGDYSFAIGAMPLNDHAALTALIDYSEKLNDEGCKFKLVNEASVLLDSVDSFLEPFSTVFFWIGVGFAVFSALMMFNFISASITAKKREIGILRAVGARSSDVFGIFFNESMIITLINFVLSSSATFAVIMILNSVMRTEFGLVLTVLTVGIRQFALILGLGVLVALVGSFFPVMNIARKKPIDAIQNR